MKALNLLIICAIIFYIFTGCEKTETVSTPTLDKFMLNPATAKAGTQVTFIVKSNAKNKVIWYGDAKHDYSQRDGDVATLSQKTLSDVVKYTPSNSGVVIADSVSNYTYTAAGTYTAYLILRNTNSFGENVQELVQSISVTVNE